MQTCTETSKGIYTTFRTQEGAFTVTPTRKSVKKAGVLTKRHIVIDNVRFGGVLTIK